MHNALSDFNPHALAAHTLKHYIFPSHPVSSHPRLVKDMASQVAAGNGDEGLGSESPARLGTRYERMRVIVADLSSDHDHSTLKTLLSIPLKTAQLAGTTTALPVSSSLRAFLPYGTDMASSSAVNGNLPAPSAVYFTDYNLRTCLHWAASSKLRSDRMFAAVKTCQALVDMGAEIDAVDSEAHTPLHLAAKALNAEIALALIRMGSSTAALDDKSRTPLHLALYHGDVHDFLTASRLVKTCEILLQHNHKVATVPDSYSMTPAGYAVISGSLLLAEVLLKGIDSNSDATFLKHLLLCAVRSGKSKMLRMVYKVVSQPGQSSAISSYLSRLLKASVMLGLLKCSAALIEFGADPDTTLSLPSSLWEEAEGPATQEQEEGSSEAHATLGQTPLHLAVENDDGTMINLLMEGGGDILKQSYSPAVPILTSFTPTRHSHTSPSFKALTSLHPLCPLSLACVMAKERSVKAILTSRKFKADALVKAAPHMHVQPLRACVLGNGGEEDRR